MTDRFRIVLVTGPSGAGRSTAINVLEDLGYEAIDNLPMRMLGLLLDGQSPRQPMALGIDVRNRDFSADRFLDLVERLSRMPGLELTVLFLDCREEVLLQRFSETRRRHPLAPGQSPQVGIHREIDLLRPIRAAADTLIDTSGLNIHQLRHEVERWFAPEGGRHLSVTIESFSYKRGLPRSVDMVFDCRFLANPHWQPALRTADGRDPRVAEFVRGDPNFAPFFDRVSDLLRFLLPAFRTEGKSHLAVAFGCTGGQHRSVALAEAVANALAVGGQQVSIRHREMDRLTTEDNPD